MCWRENPESERANEESLEILEEETDSSDGSGRDSNPFGNTPGLEWVDMTRQYDEGPQIEANVQKSDPHVPNDIHLSLSGCLSLDLEVGKQDRRIYALAGVRADTDRSLTFPSKGASLAAGLSQLDDLADGADFLLGHNLIEFDLPHLKAVNPGLRLLRLPELASARGSYSIFAA